MKRLVKKSYDINQEIIENPTAEQLASSFSNAVRGVISGSNIFVFDMLNRRSKTPHTNTSVEFWCSDGGIDLFCRNGGNVSTFEDYVNEFKKVQNKLSVLGDPIIESVQDETYTFNSDDLKKFKSLVGKNLSAIYNM